MPEMSCLILVLNLSIRNGCKALRAPVDYSLALIYLSLVIEIYENLLHSLRTALVHCKTLSVPVRRRTDLL